ncbi:MAG TPA: adenylate/guanylate cyclase domain-containing protein [Actinomycetota bacterium]|nr:adenylate/guanylate cyclase domain-containing protein [Actinomycetota bacterium]
MDCSACGTPNEEGRKFCKECAAPLALVCPNCGAPNSPDSKFCGECAAPLRPAAAEAPSATSTERRLVSVLFADLVGSTTLAEGRDAEDVRELLSSYFDAARSVVERHGGLVEKFIGDAVMAVWGTPVAHEDDAERAVRAALELLDAVEALGRSVDLPLRARAGVLTGEAAAVTGAETQGIVAGDMVNTASRLQSAAEPGTVLVGDATRRATERAIAFEDAGELTLKGKAEPVRAWRALRVVAQRRGATRAATIEPPFVGRAEELRLIKEHLHAVGREGKARLISIVGIGGIGKSRLAWEFLKYIDGLSEDVYWHQGRCPAYGDGVTFWALGEMVRMRAQIAETDPPGESRRKLGEAVEEFIGDPEERRWVLPRLGHLLGLEDRPSGEREELFSAWRTFFERISEQGTTVMVFEDLQWADPGLLDFIESLLEWTRNRPILMVTLARPELADRRAEWGAGQRAFTSVRLEPLPDEAVDRIVRAFVRGLPDDGVKRIVARSEGVPLYTVETVRMLADRGVLELRDDAYEVVGDVGDLEIPETLHALIAARLDALAPEERSLVQDAAVLGRSFTLDALAAVSGVGRDVVEPLLRDLARKEFFQYDADPRSPERGQYGFVQAMIREVAYSTLSKAERRRRHLATAHHFESLGDEELGGVVASQYVDAYRATPPGPDAEALAARARDWLGHAAERATSLGSPEQALVYVEQVLEITPSGPQRIALLERAGEAAAMAARAPQAIAFFDEAITLAEEADDAATVARVTAAMARPIIGLDRLGEHNERMRRTLDRLGGRLDDPIRARLILAFATSSIQLGRSEEALPLLDDALAIMERDRLDDVLAEGISQKAWALANVGRHREATILMRGALELSEEQGSMEFRAEVLMATGIVEIEDDPRASLRYSLEAVDAARRAGVRGLEIQAMANAAEAAVDTGEWETADGLLADLLGRPELDELMRLAALLGVALLAAHRGDHEGARSTLGESETRGLGTDLTAARTWFHRTRSTVLLLGGELEQAFEAGMEAIREDPAGMNTPTSSWSSARAGLWLKDPERVRSALAAMGPLRGRWIDVAQRTIEAGLAALEGQVEDAAAAYAECLDTWTALDLPLDRALAVVDAAMLLPPDARPSDEIERTMDYLRALGARSLLERLEGMVAVEPLTGATGSSVLGP